MTNLKKQIEQKITEETQKRDRLHDMLKNSEDNNLDGDAVLMKIGESRAKIEAFLEVRNLIK